MGVEVAGSDLPKANGDAMVEENMSKENGEVNVGSVVSEPIKFGSHGGDEPAKGEANNASAANFPKDAVDEWPAPKQIHTFYFVKYRSYDDPSLKSKMEQADKEIQRRNQQRSQILDELKAKRAKKAQLFDELEPLSDENKQYSNLINEKRGAMKPLQEALGTLRGAGNDARDRGASVCSTEDELDEIIQSIEYRIQHESLSLKEEKQLLRDIKDLESTRPKVIANAAVRAKIQDSLGQKEVIQDQVKIIGSDLDGVRKEQQAVRARLNKYRDEVKVLKEDIKDLQEELTAVTEKRDKAFETIQQLRKQRDEVNANFYENRSLLNNAKEIAAKKDVKALEELSHAEVEKFMSNWNSKKAFRNDYEKRILLSLDMRQLSRDGRMRNPNEKPLVMAETPRPAIPEAAAKATKPDPKPPKEEPKPVVREEKVPAQKESKKKQKESKGGSGPQATEEDEEVFVVEKPKDAAKENQIDEAKLKEMKREEEMAKQKQALERKKKLAEKAATKAALRAQKEAEKKQKEREKKLKKKEVATAQPTSEDEPIEKDTEPENSEKVEESFETLASTKPREQKDISSMRYRKSVKSRGTLPKAILKRKKSDNYWIYASAAAAVAVVLILALGYNYLL